MILCVCNHEALEFVALINLTGVLANHIVEEHGERLTDWVEGIQEEFQILVVLKNQCHFMLEYFCLLHLPQLDFLD